MAPVRKLYHWILHSKRGRCVGVESGPNGTYSQTRPLRQALRLQSIVMGKNFVRTQITAYSLRHLSLEHNSSSSTSCYAHTLQLHKLPGSIRLTRIMANARHPVSPTYHRVWQYSICREGTKKNGCQYKCVCQNCITLEVLNLAGKVYQIDL